MDNLSLAERKAYFQGILATMESYENLMDKHAKIAFECLDQDGFEHLWVKITHVDERMFGGFLANNPTTNIGITIGNPVLFRLEQIEEVCE
jgi:uncharacterized protein YegJ (DUF2314 family)